MDVLDGPLAMSEIRAVAARIAPFIRHTPTLFVEGADVGLPQVRLAFKLEMTQHAGSFKSRGAFNQMLSRPIPAAGVVAASGGNHGAAVAFAARQLQIPATIFVPGVASQAKIDQIRAYGARLEIRGDRYADALEASESFAQTTGAMVIHAFDQFETLLGQATVAVEFERDAPGLDALLVAVGGGGLIAGMAAWYRDRTRLVGVEPELAPTLTDALKAGAPVDAPAGGIAADSLAPRRVGRLVFPVAQRFVRETILVTDEAIRAAQATLWNLLRLVVEPGGAAAFAALQSARYRPAPGQSIGILLCGANTTAVRFE